MASADTEAPFDLVTMGLSSIDLHSADVGGPFEKISGFDAFVGGSPTSIATGAARMGSACGAWLVTKKGCANFMARATEIDAFTAARGGL